MKITKKFYVGANKVFNQHTYGPMEGKTWAKLTINEAIDHAKKILEDNPEQEYAFIVKVVKIVKRKPTPIIVEDV